MADSAVVMRSLREGYRAVVVGASGGIGSAICETLDGDPRLGMLECLSRSSDGFDITDEGKVAKACASLGSEPIDLLVCATGVLTLDGRGPEKSLIQIDPDNMVELFRVNAVGPALVAKHFLPKLSSSDRTIAGFLSARVGSIGDNQLGGWISYRSSKAALNQIVRTASIETKRKRPLSVVAAVHPGTVRTTLSDPYSGGLPTISAKEAARMVLSALDGADPERTGSFLSYDGTAIEW